MKVGLLHVKMFAKYRQRPFSSHTFSPFHVLIETMSLHNGLSILRIRGQWRIYDFPEGGTYCRGWCTNIRFCQIFPPKELHEIEKFLGHRVTHPLDPRIQYSTCSIHWGIKGWGGGLPTYYFATKPFLKSA